MAKNKHADSKVLLTAASLLAFGSISAFVSMRGPFGNFATAQTQAASVQNMNVDDNGAAVYDDTGRNISVDNGQRFDVSSSGPVARSQGS